jgi:tetratricopeptide (TPR) repeat protein
MIIPKSEMNTPLKNSYCTLKTIIIFFAVYVTFVFDASAYKEILFEKKYILPPVIIDSTTSEFIQQGDWEGALDGLLSAFEKTDPDPNIKTYIIHAYKALGMSAISNHRFNDAINKFEQGLSLNYHDPDLHFGQGVGFIMQSEYENAEKAFRRTVVLEPDNFVAHLNLGEIYYLTNDLFAAKNSWDRALEINPSSIYLNERIKRLKLQIKLSRHFEVETDYLFFVTFDGESNPELGSIVLKILNEAYYEIGQQLFLFPTRQIAVTLLTKSDFHSITGSPDWASGMYEGQIKIPVAGYDPESLKTVLYHEYIHAVIFDTMSNRCPWWINEGLAQFFSEDQFTKTRKKSLAQILLSSENSTSLLMDLPENTHKNFSTIQKKYAIALSAVDFFIDEFKLFNLLEMLRALAKGNNMDTALLESTGYNLEEFEALWRNSLRNESKY